MQCVDWACECVRGVHARLPEGASEGKSADEGGTHRWRTQILLIVAAIKGGAFASTCSGYRSRGDHRHGPHSGGADGLVVGEVGLCLGGWVIILRLLRRLPPGARGSRRAARARSSGTGAERRAGAATSARACKSSCEADLLTPTVGSPSSGMKANLDSPLKPPCARDIDKGVSAAQRCGSDATAQEGGGRAALETWTGARE